MKRLGVTLFALVLSLSVSAVAQDAGAQQSAGSQSSMGQTTTKKAKVEHLKGTISQNGTTFTDDKTKTTYTIANAAAVEGHEGHDVLISGHVNPANNSIHVTSVKMAGKTKMKGGAMSEKPPQ